jgi:pyruvate,orthophosphate dikinase
VGQLLTLAIRDIHSQRPEMEIGVCGDHCDDDNALRFFQSLDVDWISCPLTCIEKLKQTIEV